MLKTALRRLRRLLMVDVLAEVAATRAEMAQLSKQIEAALLTIALAKQQDEEESTSFSEEKEAKRLF